MGQTNDPEPHLLFSNMGTYNFSFFFFFLLFNIYECFVSLANESMEPSVLKFWASRFANWSKLSFNPCRAPPSIMPHGIRAIRWLAKWGPPNLGPSLLWSPMGPLPDPWTKFIIKWAMGYHSLYRSNLGKSVVLVWISCYIWITSHQSYHLRNILPSTNPII